MSLKNLLDNTKTVFANIWKYREVVLILAIAVLLFILLHRPSPPSPNASDPLTLQKLQEYRDLNGKLYAQIAQQVIKDGEQGKTMDSLIKALKLKPKEVIGATVIVNHVDTFWKDTGRVKLVLVGGDTAHIVQKHDAWVDIQAYAFLNPAKYNLDRIDFKFRDSLYFIETKKTHLFSPTEYQVIVRSANPYVHTTEGASYRIKDRVPYLVLSAGVYYNPFAPTWKFGPSINVGYPIIILKHK